MLLSLTFFVIVSQSRIFEPYLLHFSKCQLIAVYLRRIFRFWKSKNISSTSEMESWLTRNDKVPLVLRYIDFQTCPSRRLHFWNCYQVLNWRWFFSNVYQMEYSVLLPLPWNIEMLNMRNYPRRILILFVFRLIITWSHRLDSSADVYVNIGFFFYMWFVVCSLNFVLRHIDGKDRRATEILVRIIFYNIKNQNKPNTIFF